MIKRYTNLRMLYFMRRFVRGRRVPGRRWSGVDGGRADVSADRTADGERSA